MVGNVVSAVSVYVHDCVDASSEGLSSRYWGPRVEGPGYFVRDEHYLVVGGDAVSVAGGEHHRPDIQDVEESAKPHFAVEFILSLIHI